jgi:hypothetical protein
VSSDPPLLDRYIPHPEVRERFETSIRAPASLVMEVASNFDMQSLPSVKAIFWLRDRVMRGKGSAPRKPHGIVEETRALGWGLLAEQPGRFVICGAACQPWLANVAFSPLASLEFAAYARPGQVKIAWTLEARALGPALTRFAQETRVVATDEHARTQFRRYWRWARFGIISVRLLMLPAIRREAERRWAFAQVRNQE